MKSDESNEKITSIPRRLSDFFRRRQAGKRERQLIEKLFPQAVMKAVIAKNRASLSLVEDWVDESVYESSIFQYGLPREVRHLIDLDQGPEMTYADAIVALAARLKKRLNYLEIGVSVGKTFWQISNSFSSVSLTGFDIESINPRLEQMLDFVSASTWSGPAKSMRESLSVDMNFNLSGNDNNVRYLAADVFDAKAWDRLSGQKFNVIFSDAFHSPDTLVHEFEMIIEHDLIDSDEFVLVWDDLNGSMVGAFDQICSKLRSVYRLPPRNQFLLHMNGWLGRNWDKHPVGFLVNGHSFLP
jgi:hypothetical protein